MIKALDEYNFSEINSIKIFFNKKKYKSIRKILDRYNNVFELETNKKENLVFRIRRTIAEIDRDHYKFLDN